MTRRQQTLIFAYGTLRPGCGNDRMLGDYTHVGSATVPGRLHYHDCMMYPVYVPADWYEDEPTRVQGDLLLADDNLVREVMAMEVLAGYNAEWAKVRAHLAPEAPDEYVEVEALTFPWRRDHYELRIEGDDWTTTPGAYVVPRRGHA